MRNILLILSILSSSLLIAQDDNSFFAELSMGSVSTSTASGSDNVTTQRTALYDIALGYYNPKKPYRAYLGTSYIKWENADLFDYYVGADYLFYKNDMLVTYAGATVGVSQFKSELSKSTVSGFTPSLKLGTLIKTDLVSIDFGYKYQLLNLEATTKTSSGSFKLYNSHVIYFGFLVGF